MEYQAACCTVRQQAIWTVILSCLESHTQSFLSGFVSVGYPHFLKKKKRFCGHEALLIPLLPFFNVQWHFIILWHFCQFIFLDLIFDHSFINIMLSWNNKTRDPLLKRLSLSLYFINFTSLSHLSIKSPCIQYIFYLQFRILVLVLCLLFSLSQSYV